MKVEKRFRCLALKEKRNKYKVKDKYCFQFHLNTIVLYGEWTCAGCLHDSFIVNLTVVVLSQRITFLFSLSLSTQLNSEIVRQSVEQKYRKKPNQTSTTGFFSDKQGYIGI